MAGGQDEIVPAAVRARAAGGEADADCAAAGGHHPEVVEALHGHEGIFEDTRGGDENPARLQRVEAEDFVPAPEESCHCNTVTSARRFCKRGAKFKLFYTNNGVKPLN